MMRTYTRKRPDNQLIEDVHELCRLCLNKSMEVMPIFTEDSDNICATLALRIMICVGLEVKREDCLPNIICMECYHELNKYYAFRKKCEVTYQKLKSHILAVKEKEFKEKLRQIAEDKKKAKEEQEDGELKFVVTFDKDQFTEVNVLNLNGVAQVNNFAEKLPDLTTDDTAMKRPEYIEVQQSQEEPPAPDLSTFLSTMLIELGILTQQDNGLVFTNQNIKTLELETGDGSQVMLELMEEDDVQEQIEEQVSGEVENSLGGMEDSLQENNTALKLPTLKIHPKQDVKTDNKKGAGAWCDECGKRLASKSALSRHKRVHSGERPHACRQCGRRFAQREVMLRHLLVHDEERPHKCTECDKSFTQRNALLAHARAHAPANARPLALHRCDRCPKVFLHASGLSRHMMMHNGRVYVCGACERQFRDKSSLLRHLKHARHAADPAAGS